MKFAVVVVLFALAIGVQSSVIPLSSLGSVAIHGSVPSVVAAPISLITSPLVAPQAVVAQILVPPTSQVVAVAPAAEATYTAKNRGAVHVAPLPGHSVDATALNEQAAPGTE